MSIARAHRQLVCLLAGSVVALSASCRRQRPAASNASSNPWVEVEVTPVGQRDFRDYVEVRGTLSPIKTETVVAQLAGRVVNCVSPGEHVTAGRVVARLDARPLEQRVRAARLALAQTEHTRKTEEQESQRWRTELEEARTELHAAEAQLAQARQQSGRASSALAEARESAKHLPASPAAPVTRSTETSTRVVRLTSEVRALEARLQACMDTKERKVAERQAAEQRFAKSKELHEIGAISRNAFEADRNKVENSRSRDQEAQEAVKQAHQQLFDSRKRLDEAREAAREATRNAATPPSGLVGTNSPPEQSAARALVEESARALTRVATAIGSAQQKMTAAQSALRELEPRLQTAKEAEQRAREELANQSALMAACKVLAPAEGIVTAGARVGAMAQPGDVLIGVSDLSGVLFAPREMWATDDMRPTRVSLLIDQRPHTGSTGSESVRSVEVEAFPEHHFLHGTVLRIGNAVNALPTSGPAVVRWPLAKRRNRPALKPSAILREGKSTSVYVVSYGSVGRPPIRLRAPNPDNCDGSWAACLGLRPGMEVQVVKTLIALRGSDREWAEIGSGVSGADLVVVRPRREWSKELRVRVKSISGPSS